MDLENDTIFVFGSNQLGIHGAGSAKFAKEYYGARMGTGKGIQGHSYAIPTKESPTQDMHFDKIRKHVNEFKQYAYDHPELLFQVTKVGCGLAHQPEEKMASLFYDAPGNCMLPGVWLRMKYKNKLSDSYPVRLIVAGSRHIDDARYIYEYLDYLFKTTEKEKITIVSGMAKGPDTIGYNWARDNGCNIECFPAKWDFYPNKIAGFVRNVQMAWYSTHLVCFWDGVSSGSKHMLEVAEREGLTIKSSILT